MLFACFLWFLGNENIRVLIQKQVFHIIIFQLMSKRSKALFPFLNFFLFCFCFCFFCFFLVLFFVCFCFVLFCFVFLGGGGDGRGVGVILNGGLTCVIHNIMSINRLHGWPILIGCPQVVSLDTFSLSKELSALWAWIWYR